MGFASRPCAKVSLASRKLKSSGTKGSGIGKKRKHRQSKQNHAETGAYDHQTLFPSKGCECPLDARKDRCAESWPGERRRHCNRRQAAFDDQQLGIWDVGVRQQHHGSVERRSNRIPLKFCGVHRDSTASTSHRSCEIELSEPASITWFADWFADKNLRGSWTCAANAPAQPSRKARHNMFVALGFLSYNGRPGLHLLPGPVPRTTPASDVLTLLKTPLMAVATCLTPPIAASAMRQTSSAYSTRSLTAFAVCQVLELNKDHENCVVQQVSQLLSPLDSEMGRQRAGRRRKQFSLSCGAQLPVSAVYLPVAPGRAFVLWFSLHHWGVASPRLRE